MKKITLAALLSALLSISACSQSTSTENNSASTSQSSATASAPASSDANVPSFASVNGQPIPQSRERVLTEQIQSANPGAEIDVNEVKDNLITQEVLAQEASRLGLDQSETYREQVAITQRSLLVSALFQDFITKNPVSDEDITAEYNRMKALLGKEYLARHILVETEDQAKDIINRLKEGASFAELATELSQDKGSATQGGSLGWSNAEAYVPEFAQALSALEKDQFTQTPVQSQFGWHVILLEDVRSGDMSSFPPLNDAIKQQIAAHLEQLHFREYQQQLIEQANIQKAE